MSQRASILLLIAFTVLGTGAAARLHDADHAARDRMAADDAGSHDGHQHHEHEESGAPLHGDWDCDVHAMLQAPLVASAAAPVLILLGLFVAFLTLLRPLPVSRLTALRLDCRGPPIS